MTFACVSPRQYISPVISGALAVELSYGWTTTSYAAMCLAVAVTVLLVKVSRIVSTLMRSSWQHKDAECEVLLH